MYWFHLLLYFKSQKNENVTHRFRHTKREGAERKEKRWALFRAVERCCVSSPPTPHPAGETGVLRASVKITRPGSRAGTLPGAELTRGGEGHWDGAPGWCQPEPRTQPACQGTLTTPTNPVLQKENGEAQGYQELSGEVGHENMNF